MNPVLKGLLGILLVYAVSVGLYLMGLVVGSLAAGRSTSRAGAAMTAIQVLGTLVFVVGIALVYRLLGRVGASSSVRLGATLGYGLLALFTAAVLVLLSFVAFNR